MPTPTQFCPSFTPCLVREPGPVLPDGPYRIVRHPYYLGGIILIMGLAIGLSSVWGIAGTLFLLIPSAIYVARLEDEALAEKFGEDWRSYADRTYLMFPPVY
ncbi:MAG: isoprenylcysteine carboxylmethyltransferase family protein [Candidatus Marinimicrobia bacterium]|nr:isoprenylcysteine carboxylmethyltransferase family protein [Candidatus Neomarinimicrobiota bacterium]